jgi:hypothetical protein
LSRRSAKKGFLAMNRRLGIVCPAVAIFLLVGQFSGNDRIAVAQGQAGQFTINTSAGLTALRAASQQGRYAYVFFWKENDEPTLSMFLVFEAGMKQLAGTADAVNVSVADPLEQPMVERFGVGRAPMPLVVAVAPNGAITKAWALQLSEGQLQQGIVSRCTAQCMKALQDRKLVVLCVQNRQIANSYAAWQGAQGFKADVRFAAATEVVALDPADSQESAFLQSLHVNPATPDAVTIVLAPPGQPVARFVGAVSKDDIAAKLTSAKSSCCPGGKCGPGGCGPAK